MPCPTMLSKLRYIFIVLATRGNRKVYNYYTCTNFREKGTDLVPSYQLSWAAPFTEDYPIEKYIVDIHNQHNYRHVLTSTPCKQCGMAVDCR